MLKLCYKTHAEDDHHEGRRKRKKRDILVNSQEVKSRSHFIHVKGAVCRRRSIGQLLYDPKESKTTNGYHTRTYTRTIRFSTYRIDQFGRVGPVALIITRMTPLYIQATLLKALNVSPPSVTRGRGEGSLRTEWQEEGREAMQQRGGRGG